MDKHATALDTKLLKSYILSEVTGGSQRSDLLAATLMTSVGLR